jgi:hypothetical protein
MAVAYRGSWVWMIQAPPLKFRSFDKAEPNSQFCGIYIRNNLIRIRVSFIRKLNGTPYSGLPPPNPCSVCPLSSTEFVEPPPPKKKKKFLGMSLVYGDETNNSYQSYYGITLLRDAGK